MNDNQNQRDCNDSSNDTTYKDLSSSQTLAVLALPGDKQYKIMIQKKNFTHLIESLAFNKV